MRRLNNKGFSLVEILAAIAILAILMALASTAYNRYKRHARQQAYDTMAISTTTAAKNYMMENVKQKYITFETLLDQEYIDTLQDPRYKEEKCTGIVINKVMQGQNQKQLDVLFQKVKLCCKNYKYQYDYTGDDVVVTKIDSCEYVPGDEIDGVYKLIYKPQGGTKCDPEVVIKNQGEEWGPLCVTTKDDSVFKGWNTKKNGRGTTITEHTIVGEKDVTAYAIWSTYYTITFNEEGGSACNPKTITKESGGKWGTLCAPTKTGYAFKGWRTGQNGEGTKVTNNTVVDKNLNVYAHWNPYYTLTYDSNGGSTCENATVTQEKGEEWGTLCKPTRAGYTFAGWKNGSTTVDASSKATADITVKAEWTKAKYTLTYDSNGGSTCSPGTVTKTYNEAWGTLCAPTRKGYTFAGWKDGTTTITETSKATASITVKAQWTKNNYTLTYNSDGGSTCNPGTITKSYNEAWGTLCEPTRTGYTFGGWKNGTTSITATSKATASITVTAQWTKNTYTLKYDSNGGSTCSPTSITKGYNEAWGTLCAPTKTGYIFAGWKNGSTTVDASSKATANITVVAQWSQRTYTLTYDSNGGSTCNPGSITKSENEAWGTLCTPTRLGYSFGGWKNGSTTITASSKATANITVTAQWTQLHTLPIFTYTGSYQLVKDDDTVIASGTNNQVTIPSSYNTYTGNWKIRFLTDGTLTFQELRGAANGIDAWLVGGGGNGGTAYAKQAGNHGYSAGGAGGGGGEMVMKTLSVSTSNSYVIDIAASASKTKAFGYTANAGSVGGSNQGSLSTCEGGPNPGAGGTGNGGYAGGAGGRGGVNACDAYNGSAGRCEFNNCSLYSKYYGGGGGGGHGHNGYTNVFGPPGAGGAGGGGTGNNQVRSSSSTSHNGQANTGGGGGGSSFQLRKLTASSGCWTSDGCYEISSSQYIKAAGTGGTGIVIIRNKR